MDISTFISGVTASIVAALLLKFVSVTVSVSAYYPLIKGISWVGSYTDKEGTKITEEINIKQQFFSRFRGTFVSSASPPHSLERYSYKFRGKFINKNMVSIEFKPSNRSFTDYGVGIYELEMQHNSFAGHAVSFSRHTGNIFPHAYSGTRK